MPLHLGSLMGGVKALLRRYGDGRMQPGDAFICNDPLLDRRHAPARHRGRSQPVLADGQVRFFAVNVGHHSDVGGRVPGSIAGDCRADLRGRAAPAGDAPGARGRDRRGHPRTGRASTRASPEERILDLKVQIASNVRGVTLLEALIQRMGVDEAGRAVDDLLAYTARRLRNRLAEVPDGTAVGHSQLDDDGLGGAPVPIQAAATITGER